MVGHKGPASLGPRCTRSGSSVAAIPVYNLHVLGLTGPSSWSAHLHKTVVEPFYHLLYVQ
jgi:hypothetical protein